MSEEEIRRIIGRINRKYSRKGVIYHILFLVLLLSMLYPAYIIKGGFSIQLFVLDSILFLCVFIYAMKEIISLVRSRNSLFYYKEDYICGVTLSTVFKKGEYVEIKCDKVRDFKYTTDYAEFVVDDKVYRFMYNYSGNFLFKNYAKQIVKVKP